MKLTPDCRCGRVTETEHPCHSDGYTCPRPGEERLLAYPVCLPGVRPKLGVYRTWACDGCWTEHLARLRQAYPQCWPDDAPQA